MRHLGIGRAPGSDPVITQLLRRSGTTSEAQQFPDHVQDIMQLMGPEGATVRFTSGGTYDVHATPDATGSPMVWLLGSSDFSARLAAQLGGTGCVLSPHWYSGAIGLRASITLATTVAHAGWIELDVRANPLRDDLTTDGFPLREGNVLAPAAHGLVGDLDADAVSRFQVHYDERSLS